MARDNPPADLQGTIEILRDKIRRNQEKQEPLGEENTKAILIDPVLSALGWNLQEIEEVHREYRRRPKDKPVDYALFLLRKPRLFVEAKALRQDLTDRKWVGQVLSYATIAGAEWCVLTNGDEYRLYNPNAAVEADEKLFWTARLSDVGATGETVANLSLLSKKNLDGNLLAAKWTAHFVDRRVRHALEHLFSERDKKIIRAVRKVVPELKPSEIEASLERARLTLNFPLVDVLHPSRPPERKGRRRVSRHASVPVKGLIDAGLLKPPVRVFTQYKGRQLDATILADGGVQFGGARYDSLSTAAGMARRSIIGAPKGRPYPQTNGWVFWKWSPSAGTEEVLDRIRARYKGANQ